MLQHYDYLVVPFFEWLQRTHAEVERFEHLDVAVLRHYRPEQARRTSGKTGRPVEPATVLDSHRLLMTFLPWAAEEKYPVDPRMLKLRAPKVPLKEPTVYHIAQVRQILGACEAKLPQEELAVRILVGTGVRASELCGLAVRAPDGLADLMLDSLVRARVELRVRWDAGAKGMKSRRVPITPKAWSCRM